jgi:predicted MPP superfamily phosphohydrolase
LPSEKEDDPMYPFLPAPRSLEVTTVVAVAGFGLLRTLLAEQRRGRRVVRGYVVAVTLLAGAHGAWCLGDTFPSASYWGAASATTGLVLLLLFVASLPFAVLLRRLAKGARSLPRTTEASSKEGERFSVGRRAFVQAATMVPPAIALTLGGEGFLSAESDAQTPRLALRYAGLPAALEGFSILQLSDLHLGASKSLADLERLLARVESDGHRPDLVVFTGDVADDVGQITDALDAAWMLRPRCGVFACLGNHEYLHDIRRTRPLYERSRVPLLVNEGTVVRVPGGSLWLGGIDDPITIHGDIRGFLRARVDKALDEAPSDAFRILLSHRPEGFEAAAAAQVDLTLSGHTHGGQIGFNGKSAFEPLFEDGYLWGSYRRGASRLYTTSGFGHWFPFRLGCRAEAPILVLSSHA